MPGEQDAANMMVKDLLGAGLLVAIEKMEKYRVSTYVPRQSDAPMHIAGRVALETKDQMIACVRAAIAEFDAEATP